MTDSIDHTGRVLLHFGVGLAGFMAACEGDSGAPVAATVDTIGEVVVVR